MSDEADKIIKNKNELLELIKKEGNDKIYYGFLNFYDKWVDSQHDELENMKKRFTSVEKHQNEIALNRIALDKLKSEIEDAKQEQLRHIYEKLKDDRILGLINPLAGTVMAHPHILGFLLFLGGRKTTKWILKINEKKPDGQQAERRNSQ